MLGGHSKIFNSLSLISSVPPSRCNPCILALLNVSLFCQYLSCEVPVFLSTVKSFKFLSLISSVPSSRCNPCILALSAFSLFCQYLSSEVPVFLSTMQNFNSFSLISSVPFLQVQSSSSCPGMTTLCPFETPYSAMTACSRIVVTTKSTHSTPRCKALIRRKYSGNPSLESAKL